MNDNDNWIKIVNEFGNFELTGKIVFKGPVVFESDVQFKGDVEFKQLPHD